jgi:hypothetical protein
MSPILPSICSCLVILEDRLTPVAVQRHRLVWDEWDKLRVDKIRDKVCDKVSMTAISEFYDPVRPILGDHDPACPDVEDAAIARGIKFMIRSA